MSDLWMAVLLEFRAQEGRDPDIDHADADADKLKEIAVEVLKSLGIREDWLDLDFTAYVLHFTVLLNWYRASSICGLLYTQWLVIFKNMWNAI